jgi:hypothetical protein
MREEQSSFWSGRIGMVENPAQADTSEVAAERIAPRTGRLRLIVLHAIGMPGGCTDEEGMAFTGLPANTYRPRRVELDRGWKDFDGGYIIDSGQRRQNLSGRPAIIWQLTAKGRAALHGGDIE